MEWIYFERKTLELQKKETETLQKMRLSEIVKKSSGEFTVFTCIQFLPLLIICMTSSIFYELINYSIAGIILVIYFSFMFWHSKKTKNAIWKLSLINLELEKRMSSNE